MGRVQVFIRTIKRVVFAVLAAVPGTFLIGDAEVIAQGCPPVIVGYYHAYDVVSVPVCNFYGCSYVPQQIPCQHPIWRCR